MIYTKLFTLALVLFTGIDAVWLGAVAKQFYSQQLGYLMKPDVNWVAVVCFYLLYSAGLTFFVLLPAQTHKSLLTTFGVGAVFGLVCYATYDLTNQATVKNWPVIVTVVDLAWGALLTGTVAVLAMWLSRKF